MTYIVLLWSCSLSQPLCSHPDATWSGREYGGPIYDVGGIAAEIGDFLQANPSRQVIKFEVMTRARYEFEKGSYQCSQMGAGE